MRVMELHAPLRVVQRSKGRTATAAAAYRAAARIDCERTGQVHDYTKKRGVEDTAILAADDAPAWARDRAALWNAAERREKHPRAQTAREIEVGLPAEFNAGQRREAGLAIGRLLVARYGSAADIAWHQPGRKGDQRNYHAHILFTSRPITTEGWAKTKRGALDELKSGQGAEEVKSLRAAVAGVLNGIAARDRLDVYVEHLSFAERGEDREATQHLGPDATEMERRGEATGIGDRNREISARNAWREAQRDERDKIVDIALARQKRDRRRPWDNFYRDTQTRRRQLDEQLQRRFSRQQQEASAELEALQRQRESRGLASRLWQRVTGRAKAEQERLRGLAAALKVIELKRAEAWELFERERVARLESLKAEIGADQDQERELFNEFLKRQHAEQDAIARQESATDVSGEWTYEEEFAEAARQQRIVPPSEEDTDPLADQLRERRESRSHRRGRKM
jgi:hypothetical protein